MKKTNICFGAIQPKTIVKNIAYATALMGSIGYASAATTVNCTGVASWSSGKAYSSPGVGVGVGVGFGVGAGVGAGVGVGVAPAHVPTAVHG